MTETTPHLDKISELIQKVHQNSEIKIAPLTMKLPGALWYPIEKQTIKVKPMLGKHQKKLSSGIFTKTNSLGEEVIDMKLFFPVIEEVFAEGLVSYENGSLIEFNSLSIQDFAFIFFVINLISNEDGYFYTFATCENPDCKQKPYKVSITPDKVDIEYATKKQLENKIIELPISKLKFEVFPVKTSIFKTLDENNPFESLAYSIISVDNAVLSKQDLNKLFEELIQTDLQKLKDTINEILNFGIKWEIKSQCPLCKVENTSILKVQSTSENILLPFRFD